jgi:hypothetical protein
MSDTIRELIIQEFLARAAVIRTTSPATYQTDCGEHVFRTPSNKIDPADLPCIAIWPQAEQAADIYGQTQHTMTIRIEGLALYGAENPSVVAERILGDLIRCFGSPAWDRRHLVTSPASPVTYTDPYADAIVYAGGGTDSYPEGGELTVGVAALFQVTYMTTIGEPSTQ